MDMTGCPFRARQYVLRLFKYYIKKLNRPCHTISVLHLAVLTGDLTPSLRSVGLRQVPLQVSRETYV
jgi:hypothetical protein